MRTEAGRPPRPSSQAPATAGAQPRFNQKAGPDLNVNCRTDLSLGPPFTLGSRTAERPLWAPRPSETETLAPRPGPQTLSPIASPVPPPGTHGPPPPFFPNPLRKKACPGPLPETPVDPTSEPRPPRRPEPEGACLRMAEVAVRVTPVAGGGAWGGERFARFGPSPDSPPPPPYSR